MNILVFSTVFYPAIGGIENQTLLLVKEFIEKGHHVKVITTQKQVDFLKDVDVHYKPGILKSIRLFLWCTTYYMPNISLKGVWLLTFNPQKTWVISHNDFSSCNKKGWIPSLKNFANKFASTNIAVSKKVAVFLGSSAAVIHNGYDDFIFKIYADEKQIFDFVFLGRLVSQKGCDLLIRACGEFKQPFSLNIIGEGPEKTRLMDLTGQLGLSNSITFAGILTGEELARTLNRCRTMVIPSLQGEGFGMVALEGMACGCKIIAANAAGLTEAVGDHGKLFPMGDQEELTKLLKNSISNKEVPGSIDHNLKDHLEKHTKAVVSDKYLKFFT